MERIVIIGGGFGGAFTAKYLRKRAPRDVTIELINDTNYFVFQPLLPEVASGTISAPDAVTPLRIMLPGVKVRMASIRGIDFDGKVVHLVQGTKRVPIKVHYDQLVIASGLQTNLARMPGFSEHSLTMKDLADAHILRNHIIQCLEHADVTENPELKKRLLTFVVAGGGFSGVETMGEVWEMIMRTLKFYPNVTKDEIRAVLVQRGNRILPELPEKLGVYAQKKLEKRGVEVLLHTGISCCSAQTVQLTDREGNFKQEIATATIVTTIGNGPSELAQSLPITLNRGRIETDRFMRAKGLEDVWAVGDAALIPLDEGEQPSYAPPTAQFALREAKQMADNLMARLRGHDIKPFHYTPKGSMASLGNYIGVADVMGIRISGLPAWVLWRGFYISMLPGFVTRLRVALNWLLDYFVPRNIVQIQNREHRACRYARFQAGEVIYQPGWIVDGFYVLESGKLESRVPNAEGDDFVRVLNPGDHWGEKTISGGLQTVGYLTALEDSRVLVLQREDFKRLRHAMPVVDDYFSNIAEDHYPVQLRNELEQHS